MEDAETRLRDAVESLRAEVRARYPVVIDDSRWSWLDGDGVQVQGGVLVASQALGYQKAIASALGLAMSDVPRPAVLTDLATAHTDVRWARLHGAGALDLFGSPDGEDLQTQWVLDGWVRLFLDEAARARVLLQLPDGTVGWAQRDRLHPEEPTDDPWAALHHAPTGVLAEPHVPLAAAADLARQRLGRPYLWGGNTVEAADCSGFVQSVVFGSSGVLLPKNTRDQMKRGIRVPQPTIEPGDLLFVRGRNKNLMHVGLVLDGEPGGSVIHSCLSRERVLEESLAAFLERYRFTAARRVVAWAAP